MRSFIRSPIVRFHLIRLHPLSLLGKTPTHTVRLETFHFPVFLFGFGHGASKCGEKNGIYMPDPMRAEDFGIHRSKSHRSPRKPGSKRASLGELGISRKSASTAADRPSSILPSDGALRSWPRA